MPINIYEMPVPAELIFDVLISLCGANKTFKDDFIFRHKPENLTSFPSAYRFSGALGLGGKFVINNRMHDRWYVECYSEDLNDDRAAMIKSANEKLEKLRTYFITINDIHKKSQMK